MTNGNKDRHYYFQHTVLLGLWAILLLLLKREHAGTIRAAEFRDDAIMFGDLFGVPGEDAKRVRRDRTYGGMTDDLGR